MKRSRNVAGATTPALVLIALLSVSVSQGLVAAGNATQELSFIIQFTVTYSNPDNGTKIWNLTSEDRGIGLFMNNTWQTVQVINHSFPIEAVGNDADGNPIAYLKFNKTKLAPGENLTYRAAYRAVSKPRQLPSINENESHTLEGIPEDLREGYGEGTDLWLTHDTELRELARNVAGNETRVLTVVKKFISWIRRNIRYPAASHEVPWYPNETYAKREGDCDDQANLLITLCRICGIPAYLQIGVIYLPNRQESEQYWGKHGTFVSMQIGWHGWAVVYVPPWGWLPVDLTYVTGELKDPIDAINRGAVTLQGTIQYVNIVRADYVASSKMNKEFLQENDFYVYMRDEMFLEQPSGMLLGKFVSILLLVRDLFQRALIMAVMVVAIIVVAFVYVQKRERV